MIRSKQPVETFKCGQCRHEINVLQTRTAQLETVKEKRRKKKIIPRDAVQIHR